MRALALLFFSLFVTLTFSQDKNNSTGFIENKGQIVDQKSKPNAAVKYLLNTNGLNVQLREKGFSYDVYETEKIPLTKKDKEFHSSNPNFDDGIKTPDYSLKYNFHRIDIDFLNANQNVKLIAEEKSKDYDNYYNVAHARNGITNVHKYKKVTYQNIYNQIDVVFFIPNDSTKAVEYNFIVKPGGKISDIQLKIEGGKTELVENKIRMQLRFGEMEETIPLSWTEQGNSKNEIKINYKKIKKNVYGFEGKMNSSEKTIVIDPVPVRLWGTYYGDQTNNHYTLGDVSLTTDSHGNAYMSGSTSASNSSYATSGAHQSSIPQGIYQSTNGIIVKFGTNGNRLWGTYYGGLKYNHISDIKIDSQNNIIITGITQSDINISTTGSHKPNLSGTYSDAFLVKFNELGVRIWGTYFGGEHNDSASALAIDNSNNIYIVGVTQSLSGIAFNSNFQQQLYDGPTYDVDAFIAKFNENGNILWGTYAGGEHQDLFTAVTVKNNYLLVGGNTLSFNNISTSGSFQQNHDVNTHDDAMVYKFSIDGFRLWSTYYGGEYTDYISSIEVDDEDNIYFGGETGSWNNIATPGSFQSTNQQGYTGYLVKMNNNGSRLWSTFLSPTTLHSIIYKNNSIYIGATSSSYVTSTNLTNNCSYRQFGNNEGYIGKFSKSGNLIWGTFVGGFSSHNYDTVIAFDYNNDIFISGQTRASNTGVVDSNSHQSTILGHFNNYYIMKFHEGDLCSLNFQPTSNSPLCPSQTISFNDIPSGYNYTWTGPNGFTSSIQNPTILNASSTNSGIYTVVISDNITCGCQKTYTFDILVEDNLNPIPNVTQLPTINGDCNTIITIIPTATDNCAGNIIATTTSPLSYNTPGNYTIIWNYNDGNGNTTIQNQQVIITPINTPTVNNIYYYCTFQTPTLNDIAIIGQNIKWYDAITGGNLLPNATLLQSGVTYYASQTINGCESARVPVLVTIQNTPAPTGNTNQSFCSTENATLNNIAITGTDIIWYDSLTGNTVLQASTLLQNGVTYYATQTVNGCESTSRLAVSIQLINTLNASNHSETICDDFNNGFETVNLSNYNSFLISSTGNVFKYYYSLNGAQNQLTSDEVQNSSNYNLSVGNNLFYVRIESPNTCFQIVSLNLTLVSKPFVNINDVMPICEGSSITIDAGFGYDNYTWSTNDTSSSIIVTQPGNYSVTVSENHGTLVCSTTKSFTVVNSNIGTISEIITSDWTQNENTISVLLSSNSFGNYEYSLNGIDFQDNNTFYGLENGEYTVFIRDKNGCGVSSEDVYLLMYPKYFTPNGDGYNDYWRIKFSENEPNLIITIFDRYGKLMTQFDSNNIGWNGTYLGNPMPSSDYWFVVKRENGKEYKGHFTLKR